jgi:tRNA pseudouridine55 synthase
MASSKVYRTTLRLGLSTTTHDAEGEVVAQNEVDVSREQFDAVLSRFVGPIEQVPPAYSAVKREGKRLYQYARQGVEVEAPPRAVVVHGLTVVDWAPPAVVLDVACGPGTYVRALARDLGRALGCGASLAALRRTQSGQFDVERALPLTALQEAFDEADREGSRGRIREIVRARLQPQEAAFAHLPALTLDADTARRLVLGQAISAQVAPGPAGAGTGAPGLVPADGHSRTYHDAQTHGYARAYGPGEQFLALVAWDQEREQWRPRKVFVQPSELF